MVYMVYRLTMFLTPLCTFLYIEFTNLFRFRHFIKIKVIIITYNVEATFKLL